MSIGWVGQPQTFSSLHSTFSSLVLRWFWAYHVSKIILSLSEPWCSNWVYAVIPIHVRCRLPQNEWELTMSNRKKGSRFTMKEDRNLSHCCWRMRHCKTTFFLGLLIVNSRSFCGRWRRTWVSITAFPIAAPRLTETRWLWTQGKLVVESGKTRAYRNVN